MGKIDETRSSYVAFLDILGFKEFVNNNNSEILSNVLEKVSQESRKILKERAEESRKYVELIGKSNDYTKNWLANASVNVISISDSLFVWTYNDHPSALMSLIEFVRLMLVEFLQAGIPLRGGISHGKITVKQISFGEDNFKQTNVFGEGIVKAYELEGKQQWTGCLIDEECEKIMCESEMGRNGLLLLENAGSIVKYLVPQKSGPVSEKYVVNWTLGFNEEDCEHYEELIHDSFAAHNKKTDNWSVKVKIDNTIKFFRDITEI